MEIIVWQSIVEITQIPDMEKRDVDDISWFGNPFSDQRVYLTKFSISSDTFSWKFYMNAESEELARRAGYGLLSYLKEIYSGLDGTVRTKPISTLHLQKERPYLLEVFLPCPPYLNNQIPLIQKIVNLAETNNEHDIKVYIFWQFKDHKTSSVLRDVTRSTLKYEFYYNLSIFIEVKLAIDQENERNKKLSELSGYLDYLVIDIKNSEKLPAIWREADIEAQNLLTMANLFRNPIRIETSIFDNDMNNFSKKMRAIDFIIPSNMPLDKATDVRNENLSFSKNNKDKDILIGYLYLNGVRTKKEKYLPVNQFVHNTLISGKLGSGKTYYNAHLWNEFRVKRPDIGGLNINYLKRNQEIFYDADIYLDMDSPEFQVQYYFEGDSPKQSLLETAYYLTASQGLGDEAALNLYALMKDIIEKEGELPKSLEVLYEKLLVWIEEGTYSLKFQKDITRMIKIRILEMLSDPNMNRILQLTKKIPKWIVEWSRGKKIYLDLSMGNIHEQRLLTFAIFQIILTVIPKVEADRLQSFIQIDEAFRILSMPRNLNPNNYDFIALEHLQDVFEYLVKSFRSRGIAFILTDSTPSRLFEYIISLFSLKIIFRTGFPNFSLFTNDLEEQDQFVLQPNRKAIVINGANGEKYAIHTPNFSFFNQHDRQGKKIEKNWEEVLNII